LKTSGWFDVKKWILSFGAAAELLAPEALRRDIATELEGALHNYYP
jgi:predicted DNA-binding transcriptional regulator YafY